MAPLSVRPGARPAPATAIWSSASSCSSSSWPWRVTRARNRIDPDWATLAIDLPWAGLALALLGLALRPLRARWPARRRAEVPAGAAPFLVASGWLYTPAAGHYGFALRPPGPATLSDRRAIRAHPAGVRAFRIRYEACWWHPAEWWARWRSQS